MADSERQLTFAQELYRKLWHLCALVLPAFYVIAGRDIAVPVFIAFSVIIPAIDLLRLKSPPVRRIFNATVGQLFRASEEHTVSGSTWLIWGQTLVAVLFPPALVPAALTFGAVGDTAAALVGRRWGGKKWRLDKSIGGTVAFIITGFIAGYAWGCAPWHVVLAGAVCGALAEGILTKTNDNFTIPIAGATGMWVAGWLSNMNMTGGILP